MAKKTPATPRAAQSTAKTDVVTRVSAEAVSRRAYSLFLARGGEHGHDVEDWLLAETELTSRAFDSVNLRRAGEAQKVIRNS